MVGALEDILMDEEFGSLQKAFFDKSAGKNDEKASNIEQA